ncbi:DegV family protein [Streptococcus pneumoniae]|nr:DegV family protein [Streptococcus pneumoniae]
MKLAVFTDSSAYLSAEILQREDLFVLDIPVNIDGEEYVEGINLSVRNFTKKWLRLLNCLRPVNQVLPS